MAQIAKTSAPGLPKFIILYFGTDYRGPNFFPGYPNIAGWVPIHSTTAQRYTKTNRVEENCK